jgi:hypothetical protein
MQHAAMVGAVGGVAVAASGGTTEQQLDAFLKSGGAVLIQSGQAYVRTRYAGVTGQAAQAIQRLKARVDAYCVTVTELSCAQAAQWLQQARKRAEDLKALAEGKVPPPTMRVSADGNWSISWDPSALQSPSQNVPAVALTYIGPASPVRDTVNQLASLSAPSTNWSAFRDIGVVSSFFDYPEPAQPRTSPQAGDTLVANRDIRIWPGPAVWKDLVGVLRAGTTIKVIEVKRLMGNGHVQEWVNFVVIPAGT